jgi:hypothetical protein
VTMRNGARHEGRAITNDDTRLVIETEEKRMVLCKRAVHDVDHPGNGAAILGLIMVAGGAAIVTADALVENEEGDIGAAPDPTFFGLGLATAGAVVASVGGRRWLDARAATGWPPDRDVSAEPCQE